MSGSLLNECTSKIAKYNPETINKHKNIYLRFLRLNISVMGYIVAHILFKSLKTKFKT